MPGKPRRMALRAFLAQNSAVGLAYGGFGVTILPMQDRFDAGRGAVSLGLSLVVLSTGLAAPLVASLAQRFGLRRIIVTGSMLCCLGYAALSIAPSLPLALMAYALLLGPGVGLAGTLPSSMLASGWYPHARGRAIGVTTMPVVLAITPIAGVAIITRFGLPAFFLTLAGLHLLTVPMLLGIEEAPVPERASPSTMSAPPHGRVMTLQAIVSRRLFWIILIGGGLLNAAGIIGTVHMVAVGIERGLPPSQAAMLASLMGAASIFGAVGVGWLGDRLGGAWSLALIAIGFAISWALIAITGWLPMMILAILMLGAAGPGVFTSLSLLFGHLFGGASMPRAIGLFSMFSVPFTFCLPPLAGWMHDVVGNYLPVMIAIMCGGFLIAILFSLIGRREPARKNPIERS
ncbi:MFS family permease [Sphingobium sp. OAS761]|uniref:MFS transporter n=1 Tax=Sphingobium sp. OAS761 TaxID=2817901 RepID=UPI00209EC94C|nr:MFS transporter [Sphingobium sp. OAS761]MCP1471665.1 MFS family permease [Sphingobium sp. OAS761]